MRKDGTEAAFGPSTRAWKILPESGFFNEMASPRRPDDAASTRKVNAASPLWTVTET
jgi:hypothetical protein